MQGLWPIIFVPVASYAYNALTRKRTGRPSETPTDSNKRQRGMKTPSPTLPPPSRESSPQDSPKKTSPPKKSQGPLRGRNNPRVQRYIPKKGRSHKQTPIKKQIVRVYTQP